MKEILLLKGKTMKILPSLMILFVVAVGFTAASNALPESVQALYDFPYGDKIIHFLLIGGANGAVVLLLSNRWSMTFRRTAGITLFSMMLATLDEFAQKLFSHRTFSLEDLAANYSGIIFFGVVTALLIRVFQKRVGESQCRF